MRAQWIGALIGAVVALAIIAVAAGVYFYISKSGQAGQQVASANNVPPTTLQNMMLQAQFKGPLKDTVIQRWSDPDNGLTCYIYLPVIVQHSQPTATGFVQYGSNGIGSISCLPRS
jgi:hypothetical protein